MYFTNKRLFAFICDQLNKLSGFYGILSFDYTDKIATAVYLYCLAAIAVFSYGLYGLYTVSAIEKYWLGLVRVELIVFMLG